MPMEHSYKNQLLIAMPQMTDPNFAQTITFICEHSAEGAMGIILNRPLGINQKELFDHLDIEHVDPSCLAKPVYSGGPVQAERGFVLHRQAQQWQQTVEVESDICLTTSKDILEDLAHGNGPDDHIIALGYAGWTAEQLDREISTNAWLTVPASTEIMFNTPTEQKWQMATKALGFDISQLSSETGHA